MDLTNLKFIGVLRTYRRMTSMGHMQNEPGN